MHSHYSSLSVLYTVSSGITFALFWVGTVLLLQSYRKRLGTIKFWIIMLVPLLYFLSQFQPVVTSVLFDYSSGNPMLYSIVYVLMLEVSTPFGGILFGLAFMLVVRRIQNANVKGYLVTLTINLVPPSGNNNRPLSSIRTPVSFIHGIVFVFGVFRNIFVCYFCISGFQTSRIYPEIC